MKTHAAFAFGAVFAGMVCSASVASAQAGGTDHDRAVKAPFGVGYFGMPGVAIGTATGTGTTVALGSEVVPAPVIGVRYWLNRGMGIDAGVGLGWQSGSSDAVASGVTTSVDKPSAFALVLHGGIPLALATSKHTTFEFIPELNLGLATGGQKVGTTDVTRSGFTLDLGARAGLEVHFGFIGIPELSLVGSVGLYFRRAAYKISGTPAGGTESSLSNADWTLNTTVGPNPWAIFTNNISAIYYF